MIFLTDNTMATDAKTRMMDSVATNGNSGVGVGVLEGLLVGLFVGLLVGVLEAPAAIAVTESAVSVCVIRLAPAGL